MLVAGKGLARGYLGLPEDSGGSQGWNQVFNGDGWYWLESMVNNGY